MITEEQTKIVRRNVLETKELPPEEAVWLTRYFSFPYLGDEIEGSVTLNHQRPDENGIRKPIEIIISPKRCDEKTNGLLEGISSVSSSFLQLGGPIEEIIEGLQGKESYSITWNLAKTIEDLARVPDSARRTSTPLPSYGLTTARAFVHDRVDHPRPLILEAETYKSGQPASFRIKFSGEEYEPILDAISSIGTRMLEYGMPFTQLSKALKGITFKPHEISRDFEGEDRIKSRSILDYSGKWLEHSFGKNFT